MKSDRLLSITLYLINRKKASARELAEYFEVSVRTIQRDMDGLARAGIPIYADRGKEGGYRILSSYTIDRHYFDPGELAALSSLVGRLNTLLNDAGLKKTEQKLLNLIAPAKKAEKHQALIMDFTPWGMDDKILTRFQALHRAVESRQVMGLTYASPQGRITERVIEPLSIVIKGAAWYVYGFCRLKNHMRLFKITRILDITPVPENFDPGRHPVYRDEAKMDTRSKTLFVLRFSPSARGRITDYYTPDSLLFMPDKSIMGFFPFPEDEWVYSWILSFGPLVEVLEPAHAKKRIKDLAERLANTYASL